MEPLHQLAYILPTLSSVVDRIRPEQLYDRTPGGAVTVHDALDHMILVGDACAHWFRREAAPMRTAPAVYGWVPAAEYREAMDDLLSAVKAPGALDGTVAVPGGDLPADELARVLALNSLVHGWDVAAATGLRFEVPPAVVTSADRFARSLDDATSTRLASVAPDPRPRAVLLAGRSA